MASVPEALGDAAAGLARAAENQDVVHVVQATASAADDPWWSVHDSFVIVYSAGVDVLSDLLHRARAKNAVVRKLIQRPPWSITLADQQPLSVVATLEGSASLCLQNVETRAAAAGAPATHTLAAGDIALVKGGVYTIATTPGRRAR